MSKIYFELSGKSKPVTLLFVHGWGGNSSWWNAQRDEFASTYNVAQMDLPGHGKSPMPVELDSRVYAQAILDVLNELPGDVVLIGHSMSGAYVLEPVLQIEKVKKIILVDTLKNLDQVFTSEQVENLIFAPYRKNYREAIENITVQFLFSQSSPAPVVKRVIGEFLNMGADVAIKLLAPLYNVDSRNLAAHVKVPVRAINSDYTPMDVEANKRYFKDYQAVVIADCGHYPMLERPEEFNRLLKQML